MVKGAYGLLPLFEKERVRVAAVHVPVRCRVWGKNVGLVATCNEARSTMDRSGAKGGGGRRKKEDGEGCSKERKEDWKTGQKARGKRCRTVGLLMMDEDEFH